MNGKQNALFEGQNLKDKIKIPTLFEPTHRTFFESYSSRCVGILEVKQLI
jgi:hypothetical protein